METWSRTDTLIALEFYFRTPFGRFHQHNPDVIAIAQRINRTASAVAMKLGNLASCDPELAKRGIRGLGNASRLDRELFAQFLADPEQVLGEMHDAGIAVADATAESERVAVDRFPAGEDVVVQAKARRGQSFFRQALYSNYEGRCVVSGLRVQALLTASHIIPWQKDSSRRCDPRNGLLLTALHDRAFDRGYITISAELTVKLSPALGETPDSEFSSAALYGFADRPLRLPEKLKFAPSAEALEYHRTMIFIQ
jgi:predicted restriction endonuclease